MSICPTADIGLSLTFLNPAVNTGVHSEYMDSAINGTTEEERLIKAAIDGNDEAFASLVTRFKGRVFSMSARFARDRDELEDICQEVFIKVYENLRSFRGEAPLEHWISRVTVRVCYDTLRKNRHSKLHTPLDSLTFEIRDNSHQARLEAQQAHEILSVALSKLRPPERMIITLLELEEKSVRETAELTGWSETNVKVRAFRARRALRKILEEMHEN
jgi:RNA polymerase sigma-70 factor (ECF subfamily)